MSALAALGAIRVEAEHLDLQLPEREHRHVNQQPAVAEAGDLRVSVRAGVVAHGEVDDLQVQARRSEQEIEVTERIEVPEVRTAGGDLLVAAALERLRPAERVLDRLVEQ